MKDEKITKLPTSQPRLSDLKGVKVTRLLLHQAFTVNGVTESNLYTHKGFEMLYTQDGVVCEFKGTTFIVPLANVVAAFE